MDEGKGEEVREGEEKVDDEEDSLLDLISGFGLEKEKGGGTK